MLICTLFVENVALRIIIIINVSIGVLSIILVLTTLTTHFLIQSLELQVFPRLPPEEDLQPHVNIAKMKNGVKLGGVWYNKNK